MPEKTEINFVKLTKKKFYTWIGANVLVIAGFVYDAGKLHSDVNHIKDKQKQTHEQVTKIVDVLIGLPTIAGSDTTSNQR